MKSFLEVRIWITYGQHCGTMLRRWCMESFLFVQVSISCFKWRLHVYFGILYWAIYLCFMLCCIWYIFYKTIFSFIEKGKLWRELPWHPNIPTIRQYALFLPCWCSQHPGCQGEGTPPSLTLAAPCPLPALRECLAIHLGFPASLGKRNWYPDSKIILYPQRLKPGPMIPSQVNHCRPGRVSSGPREPLPHLSLGQRPALILACKAHFFQRSSLLTCSQSLAPCSHQTRKGFKS